LISKVAVLEARIAIRAPAVEEVQRDAAMHSLNKMSLVIRKTLRAAALDFE
jgi:hypothetical protein